MFETRGSLRTTRISTTLLLVLTVARTLAQDTEVAVDFPRAGESRQVEVAAGQRLVLRWRDVGPHAVLVGTGPVEAQGEVTATPQGDESHTIISGVAPDVDFRTVNVLLTGRKGAGAGIGNTEFPPLNEYPRASSVETIVATVPYAALVDRVYWYLARECGHSVDKTQELSDEYTLWTNRVVSRDGRAPACVDAPSRHNLATQPIGTSFYVRFNVPLRAGAGTIVEIGALAKFRYLREAGWRDLDAEYSRAIADGLRKRLEALK